MLKTVVRNVGEFLLFTLKPLKQVYIFRQNGKVKQRNRVNLYFERDFKFRRVEERKRRVACLVLAV